jgi:hypothetical protein
MIIFQFLLNEFMKSPTVSILLDYKGREKLPSLYSGEELSLIALALVTFLPRIANGHAMPVGLMGMIFLDYMCFLANEYLCC